jgi:hypothetical protein
MTRPTGVTVLAVLYWIGAFGLLLVGVFLAIGSTIMGTVWRDMGPMMGSLGAIGGIIFIGFAVLLGFIGYGLFDLREWARVTAMVFAGIGLLIALLSFFTPLGVSIIGRVFRIGVNGLILWYLNQPEIKGVFGTR